jgi:Co/Zn/Cd efflux system component
VYKGRFGDFYIINTWLIVIVVSPFFYTLILGYNDGKFVFNDYLMFVFLSVIFGFVIAIPSYIIIEILYRVLSKSKLTNQNVFFIISALSLITTNISYYLFFGKNMFSNEAKIGGIPFALIYSLFLMTGLLLFKKKIKSEKL